MRRLVVLIVVLVLLVSHLRVPLPLASGSTLDSAQASRLPWSGWWWPLLDSRDPNLSDEGGPLEKYDSYVQELGWGNPATQEWEYENHITTDPENTWWGHCHAWSAASVLEAEPLAAGYDSGIYFTVGDLKGLCLRTLAVVGRGEPYAL